MPFWKQFGIVMCLKSAARRRQSIERPNKCTSLIYRQLCLRRDAPFSNFGLLHPKKKKGAAWPAYRTFWNARNLLSTIICCQRSPLSYVLSLITWLSEALSRSSVGFLRWQVPKGTTPVWFLGFYTWWDYDCGRSQSLSAPYLTKIRVICSASSFSWGSCIWNRYKQDTERDRGIMYTRRQVRRPKVSDDKKSKRRKERERERGKKNKPWNKCVSMSFWKTACVCVWDLFS